jgi:hypothetical protein
MAAAPEEALSMVTRLRVALLGTKPSPWRRIGICSSPLTTGCEGSLMEVA